MGIAQHRSAGFGSRQGILGALGDYFPLVSRSHSISSAARLL